MKIKLPKGKYLKKIEVNDEDLNLEFSKRKKVALLFISVNDRYWPYLAQVIKDCRQNFLPQHKVDYFIWTDFSEKSKENQRTGLESYFKTFNEATEANQQQEALNAFLSLFAQIIRLYEIFYPAVIQTIIKNLANQGIIYKREGTQFWIESQTALTKENIAAIYEETKTILLFAQKDMDVALKETTIIETEPIEWPHPTLMRYHLFLSQQEKLKDYDYVFYLDADMRVIAKISDEILGELTAAEHPMYALRKEYVPPYEPNPNSTAYIKRPGRVIDTNGKPRFKPFYYGGGFQGGKAKAYLKAMRAMKENIDKDFNKNYIAIWNDESHWNKYLSDYKGDLIALSPSYIYPDSLIKEYYEKIWGCSYEPKIVTLTKPFTLSAEGAEEINKFVNNA